MVSFLVCSSCCSSVVPRADCWIAGCAADDGWPMSAKIVSPRLHSEPSLSMLNSSRQALTVELSSELLKLLCKSREPYPDWRTAWESLIRFDCLELFMLGHLNCPSRLPYADPEQAWEWLGSSGALGILMLGDGTRESCTHNLLLDVCLPTQPAMPTQQG